MSNHNKNVCLVLMAFCLHLNQFPIGDCKCKRCRQAKKNCFFLKIDSDDLNKKTLFLITAFIEYQRSHEIAQSSPHGNFPFKSKAFSIGKNKIGIRFT